MRWKTANARRLTAESTRPTAAVGPDLEPVRGLVGAASGIDDAVPVWESPGPGWLMAAVASVDTEPGDEPGMANHAAAQLLDTMRFQGPDILAVEPLHGVQSLHFRHIGDDDVDPVALEVGASSVAGIVLDSSNQRARLLWGGRARIYFLDAVALHRLTFDDIPLPQPADGAPNRMLRTVDVCPSTSGVLLACTPGAYGTWTAPWVFEQALISAFRTASTWRTWVDTVRRAMGQHSTSGASFSVIPWGTTGYEGVRSTVLGPGGARLCDMAAQRSTEGDESWLRAWLGVYGPVHERWRLTLAQLPEDGESHERAIQSNAAELAPVDAPDVAQGERPPGWEHVANSLQLLSAEWSIVQTSDSETSGAAAGARDAVADEPDLPPLLPGAPVPKTIAPPESPEPSATSVDADDRQTDVGRSRRDVAEQLDSADASAPSDPADELGFDELSETLPEPPEHSEPSALTADEPGPRETQVGRAVRDEDTIRTPPPVPTPPPLPAHEPFEDSGVLDSDELRTLAAHVDEPAADDEPGPWLEEHESTSVRLDVSELQARLQAPSPDSTPVEASDAGSPSDDDSPTPVVLGGAASAPADASPGRPEGDGERPPEEPEFEERATSPWIWLVAGALFVFAVAGVWRFSTPSTARDEPGAAREVVSTTVPEPDSPPTTPVAERPAPVARPAATTPSEPTNGAADWPPVVPRKAVAAQKRLRRSAVTATQAAPAPTPEVASALALPALATRPGTERAVLGYDRRALETTHSLVPLREPVVAPAAGFQLEARAYLVLRKWASARSKRLWVVPDGATVQVLGRRRGTRWVQVKYQHRTGWIAWVKRRVVPVGTEFTIDDLEVVAR